MLRRRNRHRNLNATTPNAVYDEAGTNLTPAAA
jgi:hypothetical protein